MCDDDKPSQPRSKTSARTRVRPFFPSNQMLFATRRLTSVDQRPISSSTCLPNLTLVT